MTALAWRLIGWSVFKVRRSLALVLFAVSVPSVLSAQLPQSSAPPPLPDQNATNTKEHHEQEKSSKDVKDKLDKALDNKNAAYTGSDIKVAVDDQSVTLSGAVQSSMQREMAMQLARAYAGNRKVVDQLAIR